MNLSQTSIFVALLLIFAVSACGCTGQDSVISGDDAAQVLAYAEPIAGNLFAGFNEDNYTMYSRDFTPNMKQTLDEGAFKQHREDVTSMIGLYKSRESPVVTDDGEYIYVTYMADFERKDGVDTQFTFQKDDELHQLHGLWFNSPMLRR